MNKFYPDTVEGLNNKSFFYYYDKLRRMVYSIFSFENVPDEWDLNYFKENLFLNGLLVVTDTRAGVLPLSCSTHGINYAGRPTDFLVNNPALGHISGKIGEDGELVFLDNFLGTYKSLDPMIVRYAVLLSDIDCSLNVTLINSRVAHVFEAGTDAELKSFKKLYDNISRGEPAVFLRTTVDRNGQHALFNNVKNSFIGRELLDVKRTILCEFLTELGVNNANTQKRERLNSDEVNSNNEELHVNTLEWQENLKNCLNKVNEKYGLNITFKVNTFNVEDADLNYNGED